MTPSPTKPEPELDPATGTYKVPADLAFRRCPMCGHRANKDLSADPQTWTCIDSRDKHGCHKQQLLADGSWTPRPYTFHEVTEETPY